MTDAVKRKRLPVEEREWFKRPKRNLVTPFKPPTSDDYRKRVEAVIQSSPVLMLQRLYRRLLYSPTVLLEMDVIRSFMAHVDKLDPAANRLTRYDSLLVAIDDTNDQFDFAQIVATEMARCYIRSYVDTGRFDRAVVSCITDCFPDDTTLLLSCWTPSVLFSISEE